MSALLKPFVNPLSGWYRTASSQQIKHNKIHTMHYFDTELIAMRNAQGEVSVFNAYCPHLGAHIGLGGKIENDVIVCPFHGWNFNTTGQCIKIPYCERIPKKARLKRYVTKEMHNIVYIYYGEEDNQEHYLSKFSFFESYSFHELLNFEIENNQLLKCLNVATKPPFYFTAMAPNILILEKYANALLMCAIPLDDHHTQLSFSASQKYAWNLFSRLRNRNYFLHMFQSMQR